MKDQALLTLFEKSLTVLVRSEDWRDSFESILMMAHDYLLFDHVVVFAPPEQDAEILFARAVGRGRMAEAEIDWGLDFIHQVFDAGEMQIYNEPPEQGERNKEPYFMGLPIFWEEDLLGGLVFVRFGGPPYGEQDKIYGRILGKLLALVLYRHQAESTVRRLEHLKRQMRLQEDFVSTISHDLRTPLGFIKGYATTLLREDANWDEDTRREFLKIIDEESDRLAELIEKILESARLQSNTVNMNFQIMRPDVLIRDVTVRALARDKSLAVQLDMPDKCPPIYADSTRLSQVLENLYSNARKYAPGAPINIRLQVDGQWVYIAFSDDGPGIAEEHQPFVFERFYRGNPNSQIKGTGLGLYICREIVRAHHGAMWVESSSGKGTTFFIKLPVYQPESVQEAKK